MHVRETNEGHGKGSHLKGLEVTVSDVHAESGIASTTKMGKLNMVNYTEGSCLSFEDK